MCVLPTNVREGLDMLPTNVRERRVLRRGLAPLRHGERREVRHVPRRPRQPVAAARDEPPPGREVYRDSGATLDHLREAVTTLEETERAARRVMGGAHPLTSAIESELRDARAALRARDTPSL